MRAALLVLVTAVAACEGGSPDDKDDTLVVDTDDTDTTNDVDWNAYTLSWSAERTDDPLGMMMSVWGSAPDDVWIVGGQKSGDGFVLRGQHGAFTAMTLPADTPMLNWVSGTSADDVWIGGRGGTLLHWDGAAFTDHTLPDIAGAIWGIKAKSPTDALAVGGFFFGDGSAFASRWDGTAWTPVTLPASVGAGRTLFKTDAYDDGYVVVGNRGLSLFVDDSGATEVPTGGTTADMVTVNTAPGHAPVAVGGVINGEVWSLDDTTAGWTSLAMPFTKLNGVHVLPTGAIVAVGDRGFTQQFAADGTAADAVESFTTELIHAVWVATNGDTYAVGGNFLTSEPAFKGAAGFSPGPATP
ncbi:MAG: hypothetical protein H6733_16150 [Alphaproteobacteria bacterium]|nr:hypothetical protein [Alphaproteobacteria bacterium]